MHTTLVRGACCLLLPLLLAGCQLPPTQVEPGGQRVDDVQDARPQPKEASPEVRGEETRAALWAEAERAQRVGDRERALAVYGQLADAGERRAWLPMATLHLLRGSVSDLGRAEAALASYRAHTGVAGGDESLWYDALSSWLANARTVQADRVEKQRLRSELQKKDAAVKKLRELTLGR